MPNFWKIYQKTFPELYSIFKRLNIITISNGSVEKLFSFLKTFVVWKRNKIKPKT